MRSRSATGWRPGDAAEDTGRPQLASTNMYFFSDEIAMRECPFADWARNRQYCGRERLRKDTNSVIHCKNDGYAISAGAAEHNHGDGAELAAGALRRQTQLRCVYICVSPERVSTGGLDRDRRARPPAAGAVSGRSRPGWAATPTRVGGDPAPSSRLGSRRRPRRRSSTPGAGRTGRP